MSAFDQRGQSVGAQFNMSDRTPPAVLEARRRLTDALHAMHVDQRIRVDMDAARERDAAWDAYDAALLASRGAVSQ